jgi:hypothetical protein
VVYCISRKPNLRPDFVPQDLSKNGAAPGNQGKLALTFDRLVLTVK